MTALMIIVPPQADVKMRPQNPNFDIYQTREAKQRSGSGLRCEGIQVPISIARTVAQQIVTSYFPLAWNGKCRRERIAHSRPNTTWRYGKTKTAKSVSFEEREKVAKCLPGHMNCPMSEQPVTNKDVRPVPCTPANIRPWITIPIAERSGNVSAGCIFDTQNFLIHSQRCRPKWIDCSYEALNFGLHRFEAQ
jgi:hypothetical protein